MVWPSDNVFLLREFCKGNKRGHTYTHLVQLCWSEPPRSKLSLPPLHLSTSLMFIHATTKEGYSCRFLEIWWGCATPPSHLALSCIRSLASCSGSLSAKSRCTATVNAAAKARLWNWGKKQFTTSSKLHNIVYFLSWRAFWLPRNWWLHQIIIHKQVWHIWLGTQMFTVTLIGVYILGLGVFDRKLKQFSLSPTHISALVMFRKILEHQYFGTYCHLKA